MFRRGALIKWKELSYDSTEDAEGCGIFLEFKEDWFDYKLVSILKADGKVHDVYLKSWEIVGETGRSR